MSKTLGIIPQIIKMKILSLIFLLSFEFASSQVINIVPNTEVYTCNLIGKEVLRSVPLINTSDPIVTTNENATITVYDLITIGKNQFYKVLYDGNDLYLLTVFLYCKNDSLVNYWGLHNSEADVSRRKKQAMDIFLSNKNKLKQDSIEITKMMLRADSLYKLGLERARIDSLKEDQEYLFDAKELAKNEFGYFNFKYSTSNKITDFSINVYNASKTKKTIKYICLTIKAINPVDDIIGKPKVFRCVGPIEFNNASNYAFDTAFISNIVDRLEIINVKIEYMDKTTKVFNGSNIRKIDLDHN